MRTIATNRGREWRSPGSIPLRRGWKPQPHWVVVDWLKLMQAARGESCPSGQRRHPAALKEDQVLSPDENSFHTPTTPTTRGRKQWSTRSIPPRAVRKPQLHIRMVIGWGSWSQRAARVATWPNAEVSPNPGRISSPPRVRNHSTSVQLQLTRNENEDPPGRYRSAGGRNPNLTGWLLID